MCKNYIFGKQNGGTTARFLHVMKASAIDSKTDPKYVIIKIWLISFNLH